MTNPTTATANPAPAPETDWDSAAIARRRDTFYAASQRAFVPFDTPLVFKRGRGACLWDEQDNRYIDLLAMNVCVSVGHAHPAVLAAVTEQAAMLQHCTTMFYHPVPAHFAEELTATLPQHPDPGERWVVHFTNSGSEAVDLALLMARRFTGNTELLALRGAYHGATFGAQSVTGIESFRHPVPQLGGALFVADPNPYRGIFGDDVTAYLDDVERCIRHETCGRLAGIILEPVQGYGGIVPLPPGYMKGALERVRAAGGVAIVDEVQSGVARTGEHYWAFSSHDVMPDIIVMAKGIGNGFPLGAVVARCSIAETMADKFLFHTYGANPVSCAAGRAVLRVIQEEQLQQNARVVGAALLEGLVALREKHRCIGDVRGLGLMLAIEFVSSRKTREPDPAVTARIFEHSRDTGIILSKSGPHRSVLRMVPPLCLGIAEVPVILERLERCIALGTRGK